MKCPVDKDVNLLMTERQGIEIDYCPECRGIWLDRGELDKIIEKSNSNISSTQTQNHSDEKHHIKNYDNRDRHNKDEWANRNHKSKKENFFADLLDF